MNILPHIISAASAFAIFSCIPTSASASSASNIHVTGLSTVNDGVVQVWTDTTRSGIPSCATSTPTLFVLNVTTATGQAFYSEAITAFTTGAYIDFGGTGACDIASNTETVAWMTLHH